ncbi:MAG: VOC family protein [Sphingomonadaceae bacterium]|jgi:predicted enzyme related to lactoylglutathione lyase
MANKHGDFIWYELLTSDADAAVTFYGSVLEWTIADSGMPGMDYRIINAGKNSVGGLMAITAEMAEHGARPTWLGYIAVNDVDDCVTSVEHGGGKTLMPAMDIPNVGRIAMVTDPQGAPFYVMKPASTDGESLAFAHDQPRIGHCAWNELVTSDQAAAWHFYGMRFGWVKDGAMDMGPMGQYEFIRHGAMLGAMMKGTAEMGPPHWNQYFRVADIDAAVAAINAGGGQVVHGPIEIPGGDFALNGIDPQGAHFGLVGARK